MNIEPKCKNCKHIKGRMIDANTLLELHTEWEDDMTNCPNCGAPINGDICEYCGTNLSKHKRIYSHICDRKALIVTDDDCCEMFTPKCSFCKKTVALESDYCPHCGAKMNL